MESVIESNQPIGKPKWLKVKLPIGQKYTELRGLVDKYKLNTIRTSGSCPNMGECWGEGTATFMILGNICTRSCGFCGVKTGRPETVDWDEPEKVARSIKIMKIKHAVITSVDRDDLKDMGSIIWFETVQAIRRMNPQTTLETLIPDFQGILCLRCMWKFIHDILKTSQRFLIFIIVIKRQPGFKISFRQQGSHFTRIDDLF